MTNHVGNGGDVVNPDPLGDKKSHLVSYMLGCVLGVLASSMVLLAVAMTHSAG